MWRTAASNRRPRPGACARCGADLCLYSTRLQAPRATLLLHLPLRAKRAIVARHLARTAAHHGLVLLRVGYNRQRERHTLPLGGLSRRRRRLLKLCLLRRPLTLSRRRRRPLTLCLLRHVSRCGDGRNELLDRPLADASDAPDAALALHRHVARWLARLPRPRGFPLARVSQRTHVRVVHLPARRAACDAAREAGERCRREV